MRAIEHDSMLSALASEGIHEQKVKALFSDSGGLKFTGDAPVFAKPLIVLAFTIRCGSNLTADYLRQTGRFAGLQEFLIGDTIANLSQKWGSSSFPNFFVDLVSHITPQQIRFFGVKASWDQLAMLLRANISSMFPSVRVIHVWRRVIVAQAVSLLIASQTKKWTSQQEAATNEVPTFDVKKIDKIMQTIRAGNDRIALITSAFSLKTASVCYEDLVADPQSVIQSIARDFKLDLGNWTPKKPAISKQSDDLNDQFVMEFRAAAERALLDGS